MLLAKAICVSQDYAEDSDALEGVEIVGTEDLGRCWRSAPRAWGNPLHKLAPYVGGFPPALANYFIQRYTKERDTILDPFSGGGTAPLEAILNGREALASDAFTYAATLTQAKCHPLSEADFEEKLAEVKTTASNLPDSILPDVDEDIEIFFHPETLDELVRFRHVLEKDTTPEGKFLKAIVCGILHGPSKMFLSIQTRDTFSGSPDYVRRYKEKNDLDTKYRNVAECIQRKFHRLNSDLYPSGEATVREADAGDLPFEDSSVNFVLTSPPYMHMLDYSWNNWLRLWWLGKDRDNERDSLNQTASVPDFRSFIKRSIKEIYRVLSSDGRAVTVIGDVRKHRSGGNKIVYPARMIAAEAKNAGFEVERVIEDDYNVDKRYYNQLNNIRYDEEEEDDEQELIDRILVLKKGHPEKPSEFKPPWSESE